MTRRTALRTIAAAPGVALGAQSAPVKSPRWALQYFYDRDHESFTLNDFCAASARFCMAVGFAKKDESKIKPLSLVTRDGGHKWDVEPLPEAGVSVFFLNDSLGWMLGEKSLWRTDEGGRDWRKLKLPKSGITRVSFRDENRGWAIGLEKTVLETRDGGRTWAEVPEAQKPATNPDFTAYRWIEWQSPRRGIIIGSAIPPRRGEGGEPAWMNPQAAEKKRQWPAITIALETTDGGETWRSQTVPAFGTTTRFRATPDGFGLILVRFTDSFEYPSELYYSSPKGGGSLRAFREKNRMVTDCAWWTPKKALIAAIEPPGRLHQLPIPGRLHILTSTNMTDWSEMKVDYRAFGTRAMLAIADAENAWVATDSGQILKYQS